MAATDFGRALHERLAAEPGLVVRRRGKSATGLARPDYFDWTAAATRLIARHRPDTILVVVGGNDGQDLLGGRRRVHWNKPGWDAAYADRVRAWVDLLTEDGREVLWLELPVMARPRLEGKLARIRAVQREVIDTHSESTWVGTRRHFFRGDRMLTDIVQKGDRYPLRQEDGIHFTRPGAAWFAERVLPDVLAQVRPDS